MSIEGEVPVGTRRLFILAVMLVGMLSAAPVEAQDTAARQLARQFLSLIDQGQSPNAYRLCAQYFTSRMTEDAFSAQISVWRAQLGGPAQQRNLVQESVMDRDPQTGQPMTINFFRFRATFPNGSVIEDVTLIQEGGQWKVAGIYRFPA